jgi:hypothetical protein
MRRRSSLERAFRCVVCSGGRDVCAPGRFHRPFSGGAEWADRARPSWGVAVRGAGVELDPALVAELLSGMRRLGRDAMDLCEDPALGPSGRAVYDRARSAMRTLLVEHLDTTGLVRRYYSDQPTLRAAARGELAATGLSAAAAVDAAVWTRLLDLGLADAQSR